ncbi:PHP domain-containing protein [archaeon]|nr:PHP domain-containing protein [archaeon]
MKMDLHLHTKYSPDGCSPPSKIIKTVQKRRAQGVIDGIAVTDHDMIKAWKHFKNVDFPVIFGEEISSTMGDILCLFLTEEIKTREPCEVIDAVHDQGGLAVFPHPFDTFRTYFKKPEDFVKQIDGIEVFNSRMKKPGGNKKAFEFAKKHGLAMTGGSDSHIRFSIGNAYTKAKAESLDEFYTELKQGRTMGYGKHSTLWTVLPITWVAKRFIGSKP